MNVTKDDKQIIINILKAMPKGTEIVAQYSGSGDSGWFEDVTLDGKVVPTGRNGRPDVGNIVESLAYDALEANFPGWEINEGSAGHVCIYLNDEGVLAYRVYHSMYYMETSNDSASGDFGDSDV